MYILQVDAMTTRYIEEDKHISNVSKLKWIERRSNQSSLYLFYVDIETQQSR